MALCSSRLAQMVAEVTGQPIMREADDTDLLIHPDDLSLAASILAAPVVRAKRMRLHTGDGHPVNFTADELVVRKDTDIQMLVPKGPLAVGKSRYNTNYTDLAASNTDLYETSQGIVPVALTDAAFLYGILQRRSHAKNDAHNTAILRSVLPFDEYALQRAAEMNLDDRVWTFMGRATLATTDLGLAA